MASLVTFSRFANIAGVVAAMKWGVILEIGEGTMKDAVRELISKEEDRAMDDDISDAVATGIENKVGIQ